MIKRTEVTKKIRDLTNDKRVRLETLAETDFKAVISKVKDIKEIAVLEHYTKEEVAEYYEVKVAEVDKAIRHHKEELRMNGLTHFAKDDALEMVGKVATIKEIMNATRTKGLVTIKVEDKVVEVPNRGLRLFDDKALVLMAMLLKNDENSEIVYKMQLAILGIKEEEIEDEKTEEPVAVVEDGKEDEDIVFDFENAEAIENELMLKIVSTEDKLDRAVAVQEFREYKDKERQAEILKLKEIYGLDEQMEVIEYLDRRKVLGKLIKRMSHRTTKGHFITGWAKVNEYMLNDYGIDVNARKSRYRGDVQNPTVFDVIADKEVECLIATVKKLGKERGLKFDAIAHDNKDMVKEMKDMGFIK